MRKSRFREERMARCRWSRSRPAAPETPAREFGKRLALDDAQRIRMPTRHEIGLPIEVSCPYGVVGIEPNRPVGRFGTTLRLAEGNRPARIVGQNLDGAWVESERGQMPVPSRPPA